MDERVVYRLSMSRSDASGQRCARRGRRRVAELVHLVYGYLRTDRDEEEEEEGACRSSPDV